MTQKFPNVTARKSEILQVIDGVIEFLCKREPQRQSETQKDEAGTMHRTNPIRPRECNV